MIEDEGYAPEPPADPTDVRRHYPARSSGWPEQARATDSLANTPTSPDHRHHRAQTAVSGPDAEVISLVEARCWGSCGERAVASAVRASALVGAFGADSDKNCNSPSESWECRESATVNLGTEAISSPGARQCLLQRRRAVRYAARVRVPATITLKQPQLSVLRDNNDMWFGERERDREPERPHEAPQRSLCSSRINSGPPRNTPDPRPTGDPECCHRRALRCRSEVRVIDLVRSSRWLRRPACRAERAPPRLNLGRQAAVPSAQNPGLCASRAGPDSRRHATPAGVRPVPGQDGWPSGSRAPPSSMRLRRQQPPVEARLSGDAARRRRTARRSERRP